MYSDQNSFVLKIAVSDGEFVRKRHVEKREKWSIKSS
jgi:hypothetical protein